LNDARHYRFGPIRNRNRSTSHEYSAACRRRPP
jgi:hypothetical protein